jgi:hypothetical protein
MSRKNQYAKRSAKKSFLGAITQTHETEGEIKGTLIETGKDALLAIGGGFVGSLMGRGSLLTGIAVTAIGHYTKNRLATAFGFGMMAAVGLKLKDGVGATDNPDTIEGIKERAIAFKDSLTEKLFLDKILKKQEAIPASGLGDVQYFTYPEEQSQSQLGAGEIDLSVLDQLENQVAQSAANFRQQQMKGILPSDEAMGDSTTDDLMGDLTEEQNF